MPMPKGFSPANETEWLALRAEDVTSTEVSALFGISPYMTEYELYHLKAGLSEDRFKENERIVWGKRLEKAIAKGVAEDLEISIKSVHQYLRHSEEPRMGSSFDFRIFNHPKGAGNLEIKNVDGLIYRDKWGENEAPDHIEIQIQHQMEVADIDWTLICALVGGNDPKFIYRDRDREVGKGLRNAVRRFWKMVDAGAPPEPDFTKDADFIIDLHRSAGVNLLESENEGLIELLGDYDIARAEAKEAEENKKNYKARILAFIGDDYNKVIAPPFSLNCGAVKGRKGTVITEDMVGTTIGAGKGYRGFKLYKKEGEKV